ncbi:uncharacterized protein DUF3108 [Sphaerotilus hippei]|uniref:Uncharacterized protein DUF3108 n=1 Tax=Sphaerotilus hippei TaxID=744406 RepID=A0A318GWS9_9BURK|nr:DUF3108 domain-containing protein [Sphaerotilus hippei]PXW93533.1 uncharacterized protein DUF3108 [Sphaerotilus hippei]
MLSRRRRAGALVALLLAVLAGHALVMAWLERQVEGLDPQPAIERMSVSYTRLLQPAAPPQAPRPGPPPRSRSAPPAVAGAEAAASGVDEAASAPEPASAPQRADAAAAVVAGASAPPAVDLLPGAAASAVPLPVAEAASGRPAAVVASASAASGGPAVVWPRSSRVRYDLQGWYRGDVQGSAQVEWLREGERYQVHLEVAIGPSIAPLVTRRMSSEGRLGEQGLEPQRYEQHTRQIIGADKRVRMSFDADGVRLANGDRVATMADVQDTASQFIQMIFLFTTRPELARAGQRIEFGLALPHKLERWVYDVGQRERLETPVGGLDTVHVRPRRVQVKGALSAEIWYAPSLQWLPVRIRIQQDEDTWADLRLAAAPEQGGP